MATYGAIEVPEICREEGVSICWDGVQVMYVSSHIRASLQSTPIRLPCHAPLHNQIQKHCNLNC